MFRSSRSTPRWSSARPLRQRQVAVVGDAGRIMTSTAGGPGGKSFGWINRELIASGQTLKHMNPYGGEDRFWIGPEGGQFSIFFAKDVPFDFDHWQTPAAIDTEPFEVVSKTADAASFRRTMRLVNYSGTTFDVQVDREISVLDRDQAIEQLGAPVGPSVKMVAFESSNRMTNAGTEPWTRQTGLLSIWILDVCPSPDDDRRAVQRRPGKPARPGRE